jgi:hypothetical protein
LFNKFKNQGILHQFLYSMVNSLIYATFAAL